MAVGVRVEVRIGVGLTRIVNVSEGPVQLTEPFV